MGENNDNSSESGGSHSRDDSKLLSDEELFRSFKLKEQDKLAAKKEQLSEVVGDFEDVTIRLQELGSGGDAERFVVQLRECRKKLDAARKKTHTNDRSPSFTAKSSAWFMSSTT